MKTIDTYIYTIYIHKLHTFVESFLKYSSFLQKHVLVAAPGKGHIHNFFFAQLNDYGFFGDLLKYPLKLITTNNLSLSIQR